LHLDLATLKPCHNFEEIKVFALKTEKICRQLEKLNQDVNNPATYLNLELKLTKHFLREMLIEKAKEGANWNTTKFRKKLVELVNKEENLEHIYGSIHQKKEQINKKWQTNAKQANYQNNNGKGEQSLTFATTNKPFSKNENIRRAQKGEKQKNEIKRTCNFCGGNHTLHECNKYKGIDERQEKVKESKLCFKCLKTGHSSNKCRFIDFKCAFCKSSKHHKALCRKKPDAQRRSEKT
jgi:predicted O-linked N-acetylglucosamine transferase (SPINDLY family)